MRWLELPVNPFVILLFGWFLLSEIIVEHSELMRQHDLPEMLNLLEAASGWEK